MNDERDEIDDRKKFSSKLLNNKKEARDDGALYMSH